MRTFPAPRAVALVALTLVGAAAAQSQPATGAIGGSVVDAAGKPIADAAVSVAAPATAFESSVAAPGGQFQFAQLAPGRYKLTAIADGYLTSQYGAFQPGDPGVWIRVLPGRRISNLTIVMQKGGAISGRVIDPQGDAIGARISILSLRADGMRAVTAASTDTGGRYRFGDLPPGSYAILAVADPSPRERRAKDASGKDVAVALAPTFYPSAQSAAGASAVVVRSEDEVTEINVQVQAPPATSVEVKLAAASGQPPDRVQVALISDDDRGAARVQWATDADADGTVKITDVVAGQYRLIANGYERPPVLSYGGGQRTNEDLTRLNAALRDSPGREWAVMPVAVDGVTPIKMQALLQPGATLSLQARSGEPPSSAPAAAPAPGSIRNAPAISARLVLKSLTDDLPAILSPEPIIASDRSSQTIKGIPPGRYIFQSGEQRYSSTSIEDARIGGADVLDLPVELHAGETTEIALTMTGSPTGIAGSVTGADGQPRLDAVIVIYPRDNRYWLRGSRRIVVERPDTSGGFEFHGLPAGEYLLAAAAERPPDDISDAVWLSGLQAIATRVTIADGQHVVQDIRVGR